MKNYIQKGDTINIVVPSGGITAGVGILIGAMFGVASVTAAQDDTAELALTGVFDLAKVNTEAWTAGGLIYWAVATKKATTTVGSNKIIGVAVRDEADDATTGRVRLNGRSVTP